MDLGNNIGIDLGMEIWMDLELEWQPGIRAMAKALCSKELVCSVRASIAV